MRWTTNYRNKMKITAIFGSYDEEVKYNYYYFLNG